MAHNMVVDDFLVFLKLVGMHPKYQSAIEKVKYTIASLAMAFGLLSVFMGLFKASTLDEFTLISEGIGTEYQTCCKIAVLVIYRKKIRAILQDIDSFWSWNKYGKKLETKMTKIHMVARKFYVGYYTFSVITITYFMGFNLIFSNGLHMDIGAFCDNTLLWCFRLYNIFGVINSSVMTVVIMGFDGFFFACVVYSYGEFVMLKHAFEYVDLIENAEESYKRFSEIVQHHDKILRFIRSVNEVLLFAIVNQFGANVLSICLELLVINTSTDTLSSINKVMIMTCYLSESGAYCLAGTFLYTESLVIANAAYNMNWWNKDKKNIRRGIVNVIQRAQKPATLNIGGIVPLNLETFTEVLKFCMSVFTLLQTIIVPEQQR